MTEHELRELDAWIAEHVMRLVLCQRAPAILTPNEFVLSIPSKIVRARIGNGSTINFSPTTDPAASMQVLQKCAERGAWPDFTLLRHTPPQGKWVFEYDGEEIVCDTLPLAIALFAKKLFSNT